jgi:hypothetical protein
VLLATGRSKAINREAAKLPTADAHRLREPTASRQRRRGVKNFSRKRPEATTRNHQYANRRVFMRLVLDPEQAQHGVVGAASGPWL